jgi:hypothetical protein
MEKTDFQQAEATTPQKGESDLEGTTTPAHSDAISRLSPEHQQYLLYRHGTLDLDPIPDMNDADPYNWPAWKVSLFAYFILVRNVVLPD